MLTIVLLFILELNWNADHFCEPCRTHRREEAVHLNALMAHVMHWTFDDWSNSRGFGVSAERIRSGEINFLIAT
jgi:hypothetical protein